MTDNNAGNDYGNRNPSELEGDFLTDYTYEKSSMESEKGGRKDESTVYRQVGIFDMEKIYEY